MAALIEAASQVISHTPQLVFSGSKVRREIERDSSLAPRIAASLRSVQEAAGYFPNHVFIGAEEPRSLSDPGEGFWERPGEPVYRTHSGAFISEPEFLQAMARADVAGLLEFESSALAVGDAPLSGLLNLLSAATDSINSQAFEPIPGVKAAIGEVGWGYPDDEALSPVNILENLATKASASLALAHLLDENQIDPERLDFVISCSEEAVGDRYQRGGGNLGKAIAEAVGASRASGFDVKNFCAAPISALVVAASLVESGVAETVAVVAGGSLPKLGMKFQGHLKNEMPILEDCLASAAVLVTRGDHGTAIRLDAVGRHPVSAGASNQHIFGHLVFEPLEAVGLKVTDVDLFATELHNPELTVPQGSGDVPRRNYKMIAALAARRHHLARDELDSFLAERCVAGFAPTQGHMASGSCLLPTLLRRIEDGRARRGMLTAKGSLFLGRMSGLSDGMSVLIEPK